MLYIYFTKKLQKLQDIILNIYYLLYFSRVLLPLREDFAVDQLFGITEFCHSDYHPVAYAEILVVLLERI